MEEKLATEEHKTEFETKNNGINSKRTERKKHFLAL